MDKWLQPIALTRVFLSSQINIYISSYLDFKDVPPARRACRLFYGAVRCVRICVVFKEVVHEDHDPTKAILHHRYHRKYCIFENEINTKSGYPCYPPVIIPHIEDDEDDATDEDIDIL